MLFFDQGVNHKKEWVYNHIPLFSKVKISAQIAFDLNIRVSLAIFCSLIYTKKTT